MKLWFEGESIITAIKNQVLLRERMSKEKLQAVFLTNVEWACLKKELNAESDEELGELLGLMEEFEEVEFKKLDAA
jgi:hypothetical protein